ncbi:MAG: ABC transporter substrate binding protein, partial [Gammaproteobacteria bacterium]
LTIWSYTGWVDAADTIGVLYPQIREPYRKVFRQIIEGIQAEADLNVLPYVLRKNPQVDVLGEWLREHQCRVVIALGRRGVKTAEALGNTIPVVAGAVLSAPGREGGPNPGISLVPDPDRLFAKLRQLAPAVERVMVVFNPAQSASLIQLARKAAHTHGLKLTAIEARDLKTAVREYHEIFNASHVSKAALWLLQDPTTVDGKVILPLILAQAWKKSLVVLASNPAYVRRGVLFSLYPDNVAMGKSLARLAQRAMLSSPGVKPGMAPLRDLLVAVNLRTAAHLELKFSSEMRRSFDLVFPAR